jgi:hypothetical protein
LRFTLGTERMVDSVLGLDRPQRQVSVAPKDS